jgi:hypothetical protein
MTFHRFTRQQLLDMVWTKPMREVAADLGLSDVAVRNACKKANIVTPPQGHWNRIHSGRQGHIKPRLSPRGFGAAGDVTFGNDPHERMLTPVELATPVPEPVFDEEMESVAARAKAAVGKLAVARDLDRVAHDAIRQILAEDKRRLDRLVEADRTSQWQMDYYGPQFMKPGDPRRFRLLSAIALGIARGQVKVRNATSTANGSGGRLYLSVETAGGSISLTATYEDVTGTKAVPAEKGVLIIRLGGNSEIKKPPLREWRDSANGSLESKVGEIAVDILIAAEEHYRASLHETRKHREAYRLWKIEDNEQKRLEAERKERERQEKLERERVKRLLSEADALRRAQAIRAYVAEVGTLQASGASPVDDAAFGRWKTWALTQADRIDPVASGAFVTALEER